MADRLPAVAWRWEDGWELVRTTIQRVISVASRRETYDHDSPREIREWDDCGLTTHLLLLDRLGAPRGLVQLSNRESTRPETFALLPRSTALHFECSVHFLSMVEDVVARCPGASLTIDFAFRFERSVRAGHPEDQIELARSILRWDDGRLAFGEGYQPQHGIFDAFRPHLVPGSCPDEASQVELLLGEVPRLFCAPTRELESERG